MGASVLRLLHSLDWSEQEEAIQLLGKSKDSDSARELIRLFKDCEWRTTRFRILSALAENGHYRGVQFLIKVALHCNPTLAPKSASKTLGTTFDGALAEHAILCLGKTKHPVAKDFLIKIKNHLPPTHLSAWVAAESLIMDASAIPLLITLLEDPKTEESPRLYKNLLLALGEFKVVKLVPLYAKTAAHHPDSAIALAAMVALGKTTRDRKWLEGLEARFSDDLLGQQFFQGVRSQIQNRSEWKLEDYLIKIFDKEQNHLGILFELGTFAPEDVYLGLGLYADHPHFLNVVEILGPTLAGPHYKVYLEKKGHDKTVEDLKNAATSEQIQILNRLEEQWISAIGNSPEIEKHGKALTDWIVGSCTNSQSIAFEPVARAIRLLANLEFGSEPLLGWIRKFGFLEGLFSSTLYYLELNPSMQIFEALFKGHLNIDINKLLLRPLIQAVSAHPKLNKNLEVQKLLKKGLESEDFEIKLSAVRCLRALPVESLTPSLTGILKDKSLLEQCHSNPSAMALLLGTLITLRYYPAEVNAEIAAQFLEKPWGKIPSIEGRALDTLCEMKGLRPKRLIFEFLNSNPTRLDLLDKVCRSLTPDVPIDSPYFVEKIDSWLKNCPDHPKTDGLLRLRDRFSPTSVRKQPGSGAPSHLPSSQKTADILKADAVLAKDFRGFSNLEPDVQSILRSSQMVLLHPGLFDQWVDKSTAIIEYCKAIDLMLEYRFGRKHFFDKIERHLVDFQNTIYQLGLQDQLNSSSKVIENLGLGAYFTVQSFPFHKMSQIAQSVLTGRILLDRFRAIDGLRAWAAVLLLFCTPRKGATRTPLKIPGLELSDIAKLAVKLGNLQEIRNPAAHRGCVLDIAKVEQVRKETLEVLEVLDGI